MKPALLFLLSMFFVGVAYSQDTSTQPPSKPPSPMVISEDCVKPSGLRAVADSGYPCCTQCDNCHLDCVRTDSNGNCTQWKQKCDCTRFCPCPR